MRCPDCGNEVASDMTFCSYCGRQFGGPPVRIAPKPSDVEKSGFNMTVLIFVIIIVVIAVPMIMAAMMYFMVLGFDGSDSNVPQTFLTGNMIENGMRYSFAPISQPVQWADISILLSDGQNQVRWSLHSDDLSGNATIAKHFEPVWLGSSVCVWCDVTDLAGNGFIDPDDNFTLTTGVSHSFSYDTIYTVTIIWMPSGSEMCSGVFNGLPA